MESILFTLDVFFMILLVWSVYKSDRDVGRTGDLGFFAYSETDVSRAPKVPENIPHA
ncbi:MAG: hypothetical protein ACM3SV_01805 [Betaproteobacteria bacterium]